MIKVKLFLIGIILGFPISTKCLSGNCANGFGSAIFPKGDVYTGHWKDGQAEGKGRLEYRNGNVFFGEWKSGKANGVGEMVYSDGTRYVGEWQGSHAHGNGTVYDKDGSILYRGRWDKGKQIDKENQR